MQNNNNRRLTEEEIRKKRAIYLKKKKRARKKRIRIIVGLSSIAVVVVFILVTVFSMMGAGTTTSGETHAVSEKTHSNKELTANKNADTDSESDDSKSETNSVSDSKNDSNSDSDNDSDSDNGQNELISQDSSNREKTILQDIPYPNNSTSFKKIDDITSDYAVVLDVDKNEFIAGKAENEKMYPASMTKVMTLLTSVDFVGSKDKMYEYTLDSSDYCYINGTSMAGLTVGEKVSANDLYYGLILPSGGDAAVGLASVTTDQEDFSYFTDLMNLEVAMMGLKNTHYTNPVGLHDENNYSTACDTAVLLNYAMQNVDAAPVLEAESHRMTTTSMHENGIRVYSLVHKYFYKHNVDNVNLIGGKTGYTTEARSCLVVEVEKNGKKYIVCTAHAPSQSDMMEDHKKIYDKYCI